MRSDLQILSKDVGSQSWHTRPWIRNWCYPVDTTRASSNLARFLSKIFVSLLIWYVSVFWQPLFFIHPNTFGFVFSIFALNSRQFQFFWFYDCIADMSWRPLPSLLSEGKSVKRVKKIFLETFPYRSIIWLIENCTIKNLISSLLNMFKIVWVSTKNYLFGNSSITFMMT